MGQGGLTITETKERPRSEKNTGFEHSLIQTPQYLAGFGKEFAWKNDQGYLTWLGKEIMFNNSWRGVKYLASDGLESYPGELL
jgi:hypothetical protein